MIALKEAFCEWQIKQRIWPPLPPHLNLCNNYSRSTPYDRVYVSNLHSMQEMKVEMQRETANIFREEPFTKTSFLSISTFLGTLYKKQRLH
jgi:hypothetical protein